MRRCVLLGIAPLAFLTLGGCALADGGPQGALAADSGAGDEAADTSGSQPNDPADGAVDAGAADVTLDAPPATPTTCAALLAVTPGLADGVYMVSGTGATPFAVYCAMSSGGWTQVGVELAKTTGTFNFLDADTGNPDAIATHTKSGLIGKRFSGLYTEVAVRWDTGGAKSISFELGGGFDVFGNVVNTDVPVSKFTTTEGNLAGWVTGAGGAKVCVASHDGDVRPGDTSWAVKAKDDNNTQCGCNSGSWAGRGAYYGGFPNPTVCNGHSGGWAGVQDNGQTKDITQTYDTTLWIR